MVYYVFVNGEETHMKNDEYSEYNERLGSAMRAERRLKKLSQQAVANKMGVSKMAISNWEKGNRQIYAVNVKAYCDAVGCKMSDVFARIE